MSTTVCAPTLTLPRKRGRELVVPSPAKRGAEAGFREAQLRVAGAGRACQRATIVRVGAASLGLTISTFAHAQTAAPEGPSLLPLVLTLIFVLALIPVAVWMLKRMGAGNVASAAGLKIVAQLAIGQRERLVVVESGDRWLILGVTASSINRVGTMPKGELPPPSSPTASFAQLLMNARKGRDHG